MTDSRYKYFRIEAAELIEKMSKALLDLERGAQFGDHLPGLLRYTHTLKGAARVVKQPAIADIAHAMEGILTPYRGGAERLGAEVIEQLLRQVDAVAALTKALDEPPTSTSPADTSVAAVRNASTATPTPSLQTNVGAVSSPQPLVARTDVSEVDALLESIDGNVTLLGNMRPALVQLGQAREQVDVLCRQLALAQRTQTLPGAHTSESRIGDTAQRTLRAVERQLHEHVERLERDLADVRAAAEALRLVPVSSVFVAVERALRDAGRELGKPVQLVTRGGDNRLDGHALAIVQSALTQLVRNAVAHGIETRDERLAAKKPELGCITIDVRRRGSRVVFACEDDGRGLDEAAVRRALASSPAHRDVDARSLDLAGLLSVLARGGISTAARLTGIAGRGVGLDLVRDAAAELGGELRLSSTPGVGFAAEIDVPQSVAAFEALALEDGNARAAVPVDVVARCARLQDDLVTTTSGGYRVQHDNAWIPLIPLSGLWRQTETPLSQLRVFAVTQTSRGAVALGAQRLLGVRTAIMRPLPVGAAALPFVTGTYVNAQGVPEAVIDPDSLAAHEHTAPVTVTSGRARQRVLIVDDSLTTRMMEQSILESAGYEVDLAVSAEDGLERAADGGYSLFLVDVEMPGADGFEFVARTRTDPRTRHIPAVLVSSRNAPEDFARGVQVGAAGYVVKSRFDQRELLALIERLVHTT